MLKKVFRRVIAHRHPWRALGMNELAELYSSVTLRAIAQSLVGLFIPVYLYENGFPVQEVVLFFVITFLASLLATFPVGYLVARIGPKHVLLLGSLGSVAALLLLVTIGSQHWPLALPGAVYGVARKLYFLPYHVDFSKILHKDHGGKELCFMTNLRKAANALGPLAGGLIAYGFGADWTLIAGIILFAVSTIPLFASREPVTTHQHLNFKGLLKRQRWPDYVSYLGYSSQLKVWQVVWPLFIAVAIFSSATYAKLGVVTTIGVLTGIFANIIIGRLVDKRRGGLLLKYGTVSAAIINVLRPLISGFGGVVALNIGTQAVSGASGIPFMRGFYDNASSLDGQRIAYMTVMETTTELGNMGLMLIIWLLSLALAGPLALRLGFIVGAALTLLMLAQRFPALADSPLQRLRAWWQAS
jgi:MFS family permease